MPDKHTAMLNYLLTCDYVKNNPLFFNFGEAKEDNTQFITTSNTEAITREYIDGSKLKSYSFTLLTFKTISYNAIVKTGDKADENLTEMSEFQEVINWIEEQEDSQIYPDFGKDCIIESIRSLTANPVLVEIDTATEPAIATYSITIQLDYLDTSKMIWK